MYMMESNDFLFRHQSEFALVTLTDTVICGPIYDFLEKIDLD